jgi:glutamyl-tRNA synthetase
VYHRTARMPIPPVQQSRANHGENSPVTRLAPSPTGALHLGNARTFLVTWALARRAGWHVVLRIEDLDGPRVKPEAVQGCIDTLAWLGLDWDEGPLTQSETPEPHALAMRRLAAQGLVYPCELTRAEIEAAASAPHAPEPDGAGRESRFPPELRPSDIGPRAFDDPHTNWRFVVPDETVVFEDRFAGPQSIRPASSVGDFVVWTKRGQPAYQLAVVVDDERQGVTEVVRGDDLLDSAARQILLARALGLPRQPTQTHLPLVLGPDGRRLAKRHGDTRLDTYRASGVPPQRVVGLVAYWSGVAPTRRPMDALAFCERFDLASMPREPVTCTEEDDRWLRNA